MVDKQLEEEAARVLAEIGACLPDGQALARGRQRLAEALLAAEQRGRHRANEEKQASG